MAQPIANEGVEKLPEKEKPAPKPVFDIHAKPVRSTQSLDDLRSILAKISAPEKSTSVKANDVTNQKKPDIVKKVDLAAALQKIGATTSELNSKEKVIDLKPQVDLPEASLGKENRPSHDVAKVVTEEKVTKVETNHRDEIARLADEAEATFARLSSQSSQKEKEKEKVEPHSPDDPLAPERIEQMFRSPRNERSPFSS
jgi:hypothetical protein